MELEEAKTLWRNAPARLAPEDYPKHFDGCFTGPVVDGVPQWNPGKGGRVWCEVAIDINLFEALVVTGRDQIPDLETGYRWYRADDIEERELDEDLEAEPTDTPFDDSPMTAFEAKIVLDAKSNGYFSPNLPDQDTELVQVVGETCLEELEAYLLLWKHAKSL
ncbi:hypothetical protein D3C71_78580 [compost metagenome]